MVESSGYTRQQFKAFLRTSIICNVFNSYQTTVVKSVLSIFETRTVIFHSHILISSLNTFLAPQQLNTSDTEIHKFIMCLIDWLEHIF